MVEKVKKGWEKSIDWAKGVQVYIALLSFAFTAVAMMFTAGKAWAQVTTKQDLETLKTKDTELTNAIGAAKESVRKEVTSDLRTFQIEQHNEVIRRLDAIQSAQENTTKKLDRVETKVDESKGAIDTMKVLIKR